MEPPQSSDIETTRARKADDRAAIREQLERMLADPLFKHSKRYPNLLRFVVERTLEDATADLKERTLGVAVFGREPSYDTSTDPIVRAAAGEIRKRIAQYYQEPGHEHEIRIALSPGSYIPEFTMPASSRTATPASAPAPPSARGRNFRWIVLAAGLAAAAILIGLVWPRPWAPRTTLDRFWRPVLESSNTVLLCIGQRRFLGTSPESATEASPDIARVRQGAQDPAAATSLFKLYYMGSQNIAFSDAVAFGRIAGLLQGKGKSYHLRGESTTSFSDLRDGPVILIGAFNNDWTLRLMGTLRFNFERDKDTFWIRDREKPARRDRAVDYSTPYLSLTEDYAVISRSLEPTTERMVVVVAGLTGYGTMAAGEFLSNPGYMNLAMKDAPSNWEHRNVQFVIATKVINGSSGPPRVVERYFW